ncbi:EamA family transporter [Clostridium sp. P21]|uniref:EamA family transporter n=1 Tax=Clostridium muellerianum TaxID=2716538 RepID=A0A7Y0EK44_9CLOT|nr:DMT family transporter [Clostridium muellerianum]NMM64852.1 EamA family transporter [Clostridium muellerianum]
MNDAKITKYGYLLITLAGACWGMMGVLTRGLSNLGFSPLQIASLRPTVAVLFYVLFNLIRNPKIFKIDLKGLLFFLIYGVVTFDGMFLSFTYAVKYTSIATASVLLFTSPIMVMIMSRIIFKEKLTNKKMLSVILTIIGCILISKAYDSSSLKLNAIGIICGIISGFAVALQNILGKVGVSKYDYRTQLSYSFIFAALFFWCLKPPVQLIKMSVSSPKAVMLVIGIGFVATVIPNGAFIKGLQYIESSKASVLVSVEPIIATLLGFLCFNETVQLPQIFGIFVIIFAVAFIQNASKEEQLQKEGEQLEKVA